jgi:hypothetical protein
VTASAATVTQLVPFGGYRSVPAPEEVPISELVVSAREDFADLLLTEGVIRARLTERKPRPPGLAAAVQGVGARHSPITSTRRNPRRSVFESSSRAGV